ncbi:nucleotide sugar dehydrogenase [Conexivisphaera calida]|uniref:UDP-N-acetyl-D-mannosamine dehydrogenase n=1 Tax=Conexivisphaera calida TaxID=1874277 RepID=A0A4P2VL63_9ARCH|nr:nucleotide sugar dehydrogenase [Conexivisphaera calida]BBE41925.1 UDP-N-acetyl-D-mannosaminuronic acid dehydrogenase [Conexivisphaera calida]
MDLSALGPEELSRELRAGGIRIIVYGLGLVGSTLAAVWLRFGAHVVGIDRDPATAGRAAAGEGPAGEPLVSEAFRVGLSEGRFRVVPDEGEIEARPAVRFLAVPVTWSDGRTVLNYLEDAMEAAVGHSRSGDAVVVKPTVPIGTTRRLARDAAARAGLRLDDDLMLIYSPERISAGRAVLDVEEHYPAIVSGIGPRSTKLAEDLHGLVARAGVIRMSSMEAAEAEKMFEGVYRDVNIALANELAKVADAYGLDFEEVRRASNSQPYSHIHSPGLGVGGTCIPVYPWFLVDNALGRGLVPELTMTARRINLSMPEFFASMADREIGGLRGRRVAVLGLAFRGDVADSRLSPTYDLVLELLRRGASVIVHDPLIAEDDSLRAMSVALTGDLGTALRGADVVVVATDHSAYRELDGDSIRSMSGGSPLVMDTRHVLRPDRMHGIRLRQFAGHTQ